MTRFARLTDRLAVAGALTEADFAEAARLGFRTIINNRPDHEEADQLTSRHEAVMAWRAGLLYRHVPAAKHEVLDERILGSLERALARAVGPVLLHCRSGLRSTIMWAALEIQAGADVDQVVAAARSAGVEIDVLRDELAEMATAPSGPSRTSASWTGATNRQAAA